MSGSLLLVATASAAGLSCRREPDGRYSVGYPHTPRVRCLLGRDPARALVLLCRLLALDPDVVGEA